MLHRLDNPVEVLSAVAEVAKELIKNNVSLESLSRTATDCARQLTGSLHAFAGAVDPVTKELVCYSLTDMMGKECQLQPEEERIVFPPLPDGTYPKLWGHAMTTKLAFFTNDPASHPASKGAPEGHIQLTNFLGAPALIGDELVGQLAVANKPKDYSDADLWIVHLLSGLFGASIQRHRMEDFLHDTHEKQTQTLEGRYRAFLEATPDMLHLICREGVFIDSHPGAVPVAMRPSQYLGKNVQEVFPPEFAANAMKCIGKALDTGIIQEWEYRLPKVPGYTFEARFSPSGPDEVLVVIRDITRAKEVMSRLEGMVLNRTHQLEVSNEALQSFAYAASHDLREPLNKITNFGNRLAGLLREEAEPKVQECLEVMQSASTRMTKLIDDLLSYSKAGGGEQVPFMDVDLNVVVAEVLTDLELVLDEAKAEVIVGDLPTVRGHSAQFRILFQNLLSNAIKFRKPDVLPVVRIDGTVEEDLAFVTVADNGIGFDQKFADKIFSVFTRLHTRFAYPGTGIGLALCRRIISHYGGYISAKGEPGKGATFTVTIPLRPAEN